MLWFVWPKYYYSDTLRVNCRFLASFLVIHVSASNRNRLITWFNAVVVAIHINTWLPQATVAASLLVSSLLFWKVYRLLTVCSWEQFGQKFLWWLFLPQWKHVHSLWQPLATWAFCRNFKQDLLSFSILACFVVYSEHSSNQWLFAATKIIPQSILVRHTPWVTASS